MVGVIPQRSLWKIYFSRSILILIVYCNLHNSGMSACNVQISPASLNMED